MTEEEYILSLVRSVDTEMRTLGCITLAGKGLRDVKSFLEHYGVESQENIDETFERIRAVPSDIITMETKVNRDITHPVIVVKNKDFYLVSFRVTWIGSPAHVNENIINHRLSRYDLKIIE